jgi:flagellar biosynthetic protein FlhB
MENADKESKTEAPTEKRVKDSLEEGNVPVSREIATAASMLAFCALYILNGEDLARGLTNLMSTLTESTIGSEPISNQDFLTLFSRLSLAIAILVGPFFIVIMATAIIASVAQNEPRFVSKRITPQFSRISPTAGWSRLFSMKSFMEFLKSFAKIAGAIVIVAIGMMPTLKDMLRTMYQLPMGSLFSMSAMVSHLLIWVTGVAILIAIVDFIWQRHSWWTELRMSRHELKEEFKQSEGDPIVKSRLRSISRDRARSRMMQAVPTATLIVANPTHFAVALRYDRERDAAPIVVAKGTDLIALRIRAIAEASSVPVFERVELARALHKAVKIDQIIPMQFYKALAELIRAVYDKRN